MDPVIERAVCLRQWDYSETSQTAALFTRGLGIVRVLAKGSRRHDPRFSGGLEVATLGEIVLYPKQSGLATLAGWDLLGTFRGIRASLDRYYAAMLAIDLPRHLLGEDQPHERAFDGLEAALGAIASDEPSPAMARWLWLLLDEAGYRPDLSAARRASGFSPGLGRLVAADERVPGAVWTVRPETVGALLALSEGRDSDVLSLERAGRLLAWYAREIVGHELPTLAPVFGEHDPASVVR
jgi:recombinational DNA repair protein (RecF pathway)